MLYEPRRLKLTEALLDDVAFESGGSLGRIRFD